MTAQKPEPTTPPTAEEIETEIAETRERLGEVIEALNREARRQDPGQEQGC